MGYLPNFCPSCPGGNYIGGLHIKKERKKKMVTLEVPQLGTRNSYNRGCLMVESRKAVLMQHTRASFVVYSWIPHRGSILCCHFREPCCLLSIQHISCCFTRTARVS